MITAKKIPENQIEHLNKKIEDRQKLIDEHKKQIDEKLKTELVKKENNNEK